MLDSWNTVLMNIFILGDTYVLAGRSWKSYSRNDIPLRGCFTVASAGGSQPHALHEVLQLALSTRLRYYTHCRQTPETLGHRIKYLPAKSMSNPKPDSPTC